jgi:hypothetical protein
LLGGFKWFAEQVWISDGSRTRKTSESRGTPIGLEKDYFEKKSYQLFGWDLKRFYCNLVV